MTSQDLGVNFTDPLGHAGIGPHGDKVQSKQDVTFGGGAWLRLILHHLVGD